VAGEVIFDWKERAMSEWQPALIISGPHDHSGAHAEWLSCIGKRVRIRPSEWLVKSEYCEGKIFEAMRKDVPGDAAVYLFCEHEILTD
jgi:hypothetical protein